MIATTYFIVTTIIVVVTTIITILDLVPQVIELLHGIFGLEFFKYKLSIYSTLARYHDHSNSLLNRPFIFLNFRLSLDEILNVNNVVWHKQLYSSHLFHEHKL